MTTFGRLRAIDSKPVRTLAIAELASTDFTLGARFTLATMHAFPSQ